MERSDAEIARELLKGDVFSSLSERSLAVYLGDLRRGKLRWWQTRNAQLQAVVDLIGFERADLGFRDAAQPHAQAFSTFPALRPLDLVGESLPDIYVDVELREGSAFNADFWLNPDSRHPLNLPSPGLYWLQIPAGHGLDLLWQQLLARDHAQCIELAALRRALPGQGSGKPIILRVAQPLEVDRDGQAVMAPPSSPILVLSRHPPPLFTGADRHLTAYRLRELLGLSPPHIHGEMRRELAIDWQDQLTKWAISRLQGNETLLSEADVRRWIDSRLPYRSVVSTPDELIALCGVLHQSGHVHHASAKGASLFRACMSNQDKAKRLAKLIKHRYLHGSAPWDEALLPEQWAPHLQPGVGDEACIASLVTSLVEEKSVARRRHAQGKLLARTAQSALLQLEGEFDLVRHDDGCYHMQLPFLANVLAADEVLELLVDRRTGEWARLYLDPSRRVVVEMALWRRSLGELLSDTEYVLSRSEAPLVQLAVEDALFWVIGLKLSQPGISVPTSAQEVLQSLARRIVNRITMTLLKPVTRDLRVAEEALAWVAICWHWSISVTLPQKMALPSDQAWLFPGWADREHLLDYALDHLPFESSEVLSGAGKGAGRGAWTMWWPAARRIVDGLLAPPSGPPDALVPALLLSSLRHTWPIDPSWIGVTVNSAALKTHVRQAIGEIDAPARRRLLDALLTAMDWQSGYQDVPESKIDKIERFKSVNKSMMISVSWLAQDAIEKLDASAVIDVAGPARFDKLLLCLGSKNASIVSELAEAIPRQPGWKEVFRQLIPILSKDSWATTVEWLNHFLDMDIPLWLWREDAPKVIGLLSYPSQLNELSMQLLAMATPDAHVAAVADILSDTQYPLLRGYRAVWALERLPHHGVKLEKLVNDLNRNEWSSHVVVLSQPADA